MFALFRKKAPAAPLPWRCLMGWRVLTYQVGENWLSLQIEPMRDAPCRVYLPSDEAWAALAPAWARGDRGKVLERLRRVAWNRDLIWTERPDARFWHRHVYDPVDGSLEATPGGRRLELMRVFHPDSPAGLSRQDAKAAWCAGAEQMCLQAEGEVAIDPRELVPGSVFQLIELPTLRRNPRVSLALGGAR